MKIYFQIILVPRGLDMGDAYWFRIKSAGNHKILCHSEWYQSKAAVMRAIRLIDPKGKALVEWKTERDVR